MPVIRAILVLEAEPLALVMEAEGGGIGENRVGVGWLPGYGVRPPAARAAASATVKGRGSEDRSPLSPLEWLRP